MSSIDYGQVSVELGDEVYTLKPTLAAMQQIDRQFGSIRDAVLRVRSLSFESVVAVIAAGAGLDQREAKALPEQVFAAGLMVVAAPVADYLAMLMNPSGREIEEGEGGPGKP